MDIYSIIPLYTDHGILFLIITSILLSALLGAVILATSTTEPEVEISDIETSSAKPVALPTTVLFSSACMLFLVQWESWPPEGPAAVVAVMSTFFYDWRPRGDEFRYERLSRSTDGFIPVNRRSYKPRLRERAFFAKKAPLLTPVCLFTIKKSKRQLFVDRLSDLSAFSNSRKVTRLYNKLSTYGRKRVQFITRIRTVVTAPVALRWRFPPRHSAAMMRSRWLWRWRRGRAISLRRTHSITWKSNDEHKQETFWERVAGVVVPFISIPEDRFAELFDIELKIARLEEEEKERILAENMPPAYSYDTLAFLKSPLGWRKLFPSYIWSVYVLPTLMFISWRIRAFCVYFLCFMLFSPFILVAIVVFAQDYYILWCDLWSVHGATAEYIHQFTELRHVDAVYSRALSLLLLPFAVALFLTQQYYWTVLALSITLALDGVLSSGGELSDTAFQESRTRWLHLNQRRIRGIRRRIRDEGVRVRSRRHPDRGRTDTILWFVLLSTSLREVQEFFVGILMRVVHAVGWVVHTVEGVWNSGPVRCVRAMINRLCLDAYNSSVGRAVRSAFWEIYIQAYTPAAVWLRALCQELWVQLVYYIGIVWNHAWEVFYSIEYTPRILSGLTSIHRTHCVLDAYSAIFVVVFSITMIYFLTTFAVLLGWRRTYTHVLIRRPSTILYIVLLIALLYVFAVFYRYTHSVLEFGFDSFPYVNYDLKLFYQWYLEGDRGIARLKRHLFGQLLFFKYVWWSIFWACVGYAYTRWVESVLIYVHEPIRFRLFVNGWLRFMYRWNLCHSTVLLKEEIPSALSAEETIKQLSIKARGWRAKKKQARWLRTRTMKWVHRTYIYKYYDPYPDEKYRLYAHGNAYVAQRHHRNPFYAR
jgi:hypothetical protein